MKLINKEDYLTFAFCYFGNKSLKSLFKLAAELCTGYKASKIQGKEAFVFKTVRNVPTGNSAGKAFYNGSFTNSRLTNDYRIIFCTTAKHLHYTADFFISANYRVNFILTGKSCKVTAIFFQRTHCAFGILGIYSLVSADRF